MRIYHLLLESTKYSLKLIKSQAWWIVLWASLIFTFQWWILPGWTQQPITIKTLIRADEAQQLEPLVTKFNQQHPDIKFQIVEAPSDSNQVEDLYTSSFLLGNSPFDLVYMDIVWTPKFAAAGWLQDLSDRLSQNEAQKYLKGDIEGGMYENKLYRLPFRSDAGMLYYRQDLLDKAGYAAPETFQELLEISQDLQQQGLVEWGYVWQGKQYEGLAAMFVEILQGSGAFWVDPDTLEVGLDRPQAIEAVEFLRQAIALQVSPPGVTTYAEEETRLLFQNGKVAFLRNWPYVYSLALDSPIAGKYSIKPMVHAVGQSSGATLGGWGIGIAKTSKHPDAAWEVIKFLSSEASQREFILATGFVPSRVALFNDKAIVAKYNYYPKLLGVVQSSALRPPISQYAQASDILQRYLSAAITGKMTPEKAMQAAAIETRNLLAS
ncbi:ABC transporter substrate-binding protein [Waterburya agarophytonicola K14]|uniref:ABC transporter substrate-binding protein n=1 Tax=Waterburya agarophytonicola KI4 TaxID=2874699 RepID=A0A964FKF9_9CYAN|nr:ABC transporter substrate-binding protein [Waterburya agarophytonicola]MCC0179174.1 ABC transporter substrate-binding protein [Waterburya agarophytonicola KI4]